MRPDPSPIAPGGAAAKDRPSICFFVRQFDGGGAQKIMIKLANATADAGPDVQIVTLQSSGLFQQIAKPNVTVFTLPARRLLTCAPALARHIRAHKPDVVVATEVVPNIMLVLGTLLSGRRAKTRLVLREALYPSIGRAKSPFRQARIGYHLARFFYPRADVIIAIARGMVDDLAKLAHMPKRKIVPININPCVDDRLLRLAGDPAPHPWLADASVPCAIAVGRLAPQKGFDVAVAAIAEVRKRRPIRLLIVGDGPLKGALEAQIERLGLTEDVRLAGSTANPYAYMAHCSMFLMPSRYEGLGNVLIEALACGAPCIAADCLVGPRETLADGEYGKLVPVDDVKAMARAIEETLDAPPDRERLRRRGLDFTSEASIREYLPVLLGRAPSAT